MYQVNGCPKTIDGDLKNEYVPISFGFDTAAKTFRCTHSTLPVRYFAVVRVENPSGAAAAALLVVLFKILYLKHRRATEWWSRRVGYPLMTKYRFYLLQSLMSRSEDRSYAEI